MNAPLITKDAEVLWDVPTGTEIIIVEKLESFSEQPGYEFIKRVFDFTASVILLIVLMLPMLLIGMIIVLTSPGGAIYCQTRLGKNEVPFTLYKYADG